jgi:cytochrome b pre-mRNA-processing protein 3
MPPLATSSGEIEAGSMLKSLFKPRPAVVAGRALYARAVAQARTPALYVDLSVPDTPEGRFEAYSLHVYLLLERLKGHGEQAAETAQALFDTYVSDLDHALRELGVGDLSVGKKIRKLGEAFYGRVRSFEAALAALPETAELEAVLARTVYASGGAESAPGLAAYVMRQREALAAQPLERLFAGEAAWGPL